MSSLLLNFSLNTNRYDEAVNLCWNLNFTSTKNIISIPNEINNNAKAYRSLYLSYLDKLNDNFNNIKVDKLPYWLLSSVTCKQGSFANPFEIKNAIKLIYLETFLKQNSFNKVILIGNVDIRIILVIKSLLKNYKIELVNKSTTKRFNRIRKYFSILKTFWKLIFNTRKKLKKNLNIKSLLIDYSSSNRQINYWNDLINNFERKNVLKLNIDIDSKMCSYSNNDEFKSILLYNNYSFWEVIKKYFKINSLYKNFNDFNLFDYNDRLNLRPLYSELIFKDFIGSNALFNAITISSLKNILNKHPNISLIIYPRENQAWERILLFYNKNRSISIGNLHAGFKYWDLRNYLNESKYLKQNSMIPSIFTLYSKKLIDILKNDKIFSNENFQFVESLRLKKYKRPTNSTIEFKGLLVILDYDTDSSIQQINLVLGFMKKYNISNVSFKAHINNHEFLSVKYTSIKFEKRNLDDLVNSSSHFFCSNNTTLSLELISSGLNTSIMDSGSNLDMDPSKIYGVETKKIKSEEDLLGFIKLSQPNLNIDLFKLDDDFKLWKKLLKSYNNEILIN
tara:strand:+ start:5108 stop:6799 length:1692 start_codon:yes stop_codon:yes gene_type:complete